MKKNNLLFQVLIIAGTTLYGSAERLIKRTENMQTLKSSWLSAKVAEYDGVMEYTATTKTETELNPKYLIGIAQAGLLHHQDIKRNMITFIIDGRASSQAQITIDPPIHDRQSYTPIIDHLIDAASLIVESYKLTLIIKKQMRCCC